MSFVRLPIGTAPRSRGKTRKKQSRPRTLRLEPWRIELYDLLDQNNRKVWQAES